MGKLLSNLWGGTILCILLTSPFWGATSSFGADSYRWNLGNATLTLSKEGKSQLVRSDGSPVCSRAYAFSLKTADGKVIRPSKILPSKKIGGVGDYFTVKYENGAVASYRARPGNGYVLVDLLSVKSPEDLDECVVFMTGVPSGYIIPGWINTATLDDGLRVGVMTTSVNVLPHNTRAGGASGDQEECSHTFKPLARSDADDSEIRDRKQVAEFCAVSKRGQNDGWSYCGKNFIQSIDLTGCVRLRARVYGDGKGESLKIQLGGKTGHRDDYIRIDFNGWKICELDKPALNDVTYDDVRQLYFYYNGLPAETSVRCLIDWVDVVFDDGNGGERVVRLEDFASNDSPLWDEKMTVLEAKSFARHKIFPASCAVIAVQNDDWAKTVESMQTNAGIPSPKPSGGWRGASPYIHQSYFFLTNFKESEYDAALAIAKRGGFKQILLLQNSWCKSTGTYEVNEKNFPGGFDALLETVKKFKKEGIRFGLHLLAASVDSNDPYLTPIPDKRFVTDASSTLAEDLPDSSESKTVKTLDDGSLFPVGEDPYMGSGQVVRIDDELIGYSRTEKTGLFDCSRGLYGTRVASHAKGTRVAHFTRAYGYHLPDLDTDFIDEIATNFAKVANKLPLDMIYFDGSEKLQRPDQGSDHWYYNARLHKAFYDALKNKNLLFQASSCSPFSWHMISRNASADGHDDLKAYLEERSGGFSAKHPQESYLDVGWYYAYDQNATPDMYEYCLGATIAYDASFSFQTSVGAANAHPFIGEILDMIREYEELRLSGRIPEEIRPLFELDKRLAGKKTVEERNALLDLRREFHYEQNADGGGQFRRIVYPRWQNVYSGKSDLGGTTSSDAREENGTYFWELKVDSPCRAGLQVQFKSEGSPAPESKLINPQVSFTKIGEKDAVARIAVDCELTKGQFAFALPGEREKVYGRPLDEPLVLNETTCNARLEPGVYLVKFEIESGTDVPARVRTPLYTDEIYSIPD